MTLIGEYFKPASNYSQWAPSKKIIPPIGVNPTLILGAELEIEGLDSDSENRSRRCVPGIIYHEDNSLRNNGGEYVTLPMTLNVMDYVLNQFFEKNKFTSENYSERCSVHVHANCMNMTFEQLRLLLCIYQIVEKIFFAFIKGGRDDNIFCVPWHECYISHAAFQSDAHLISAIKRWKKYTALNLIPLMSQGSIEFRHMDGTHDKDRIILWCDIIGSLFKYATTHTFEEVKGQLLDLNTTSGYYNFMQSIFPPEHLDVLTIPGYRDHLEDGVLNMKLTMMSPVRDKAITEYDPTRHLKVKSVQSTSNTFNISWIDDDGSSVSVDVPEQAEVAAPMAPSIQSWIPPPLPATPFPEYGVTIPWQIPLSVVDPHYHSWLYKFNARNTTQPASVSHTEHMSTYFKNHNIAQDGCVLFRGRAWRWAIFGVSVEAF